MPVVPNLINSDIRSVVRTYRIAAGRLDAVGVAALKDAVLDGKGITASERKDVQALLDADLFEPAARADVFAFMGTAPVPPSPQPPPGPSAAKLVSTATLAMNAVYALSNSTRSVYAHPIALGASKATSDAFLNVAPTSAEGRRLRTAFLTLCERSMYPVSHSTDPFAPPTPIKHVWGATAARWVYDTLMFQGRTDLLPPEAMKYFR